MGHEDATGYIDEKYMDAALEFLRNHISKEQYNQIMESDYGKKLPYIAARFFLDNHDWKEFLWIAKHGNKVDDMWIDDDRLTQEDFGIGTYPKKCPICGKDSIHLLMYRHSEMSTNGACWIWCSSCEKYSHINVTIPDWWDNYDRLGSDKLFASPEHNIDDERENIDKWVNKLINEKVDTPKEEPKSINDDKTLYVIKINTQKILTEEKAELAAQLCRCDKEQAINMIENHGFELYPMPAADISLVKKELEFKKFNFTVSPEYKW